MPSAKRVSWAQLKVGITVVVAMVLVAILVYLMSGEHSLFAKDVALYTYLDDAAGLTKGASVRLNGLVMGKVKTVELSGLTDPRRIIRVTMEVDQRFLPNIPVDSQASISAENLLGTKFINIKMGKAPARIQPGAEITSLDTMQYDELVQSGYSLLASAQGLLKRIDAIVGIVESGKGSIGKLLVDEEIYNRANSLVAEFQKTAAALNSGKGTVSRLLHDEQLYDEIRSPVSRLDGLLQGLQDGKGTAGKLLQDPAMYNEVNRNLAELRRVLEDINAGKGTAGRLLKNDELHNQIQALLNKVDSTVNRVNQGQGTLGQLLVNPRLYESLDNTTRELNGLLKDFRSNPKKFMRIKLGLF
jgi:phospholipid/cholesterol/gamma-HCH transport system substrate-binding protein